MEIKKYEKLAPQEIELSLDFMTRKISILSIYALILVGLVCCARSQEPAVPLIILTPEEGFDDLVPEEEESLIPDEAVEEQAVEVYSDDPQPYNFVAQPGESVGLYSDWTKLEVEQLLSGLKISSPRYLKAGARYTLVMAPNRWDGFVRGRAERERKRRARFFEAKFIKHYRRHAVLSGETPGSIARKYEIPLWLLEETNPNMEPASLSAGEEVDVPIVVAKGGDEPEQEMVPTLVPAKGGDAYTRERERVMAPETASRPSEAPTPKKAEAPAPTQAPAPAKILQEDRVEDEERLDEAVDEMATMLRIRIKSGETLGDIAAMSKMTVDGIIKANGISNPNMLRVGQEIALPLTTDKWPDFLLARERRNLLLTAIQSYERRGFKVVKEAIREGETAYGVAERVGAERSSLALLNPAQNFDALSPGQRLRFAVPKDTTGTDNP